MSNLRETRNCIAYAYRKGFINDREFVLLYDANRSKNPDFPYWNYERFELDGLTNAECNAEFRFYKHDIYKLADALQLPDEFVTYNGLIVESIPALCIYLKRFSYPCHYSDMVFHFARPVPEICIITNHMIDWIYNRWHHLLTTYNHNLLSPANLVLYADAVHQSGAALDNCWGFIDGTVRPVCRPGVNQRVIYNGHKRVHSIKFQSVALPNGLVGHLYGPVEGRRHDSSMLASSGLLQELQRFSNSPITGTPICLYGDPAYPLRAHLQGPFRGAALTQDQKNYNTAMNGARTAVEWVFGDIINYLKFLDFKKNLKIGLRWLTTVL
ncbi:uncharacterized protein LOC141866231 [Acropora palmata]|uniref:uncharacterized protein LOC141866231 n=1 Tax=Acropora palmata TaxID=6131 RepID=UPI003DA0B28B